MFGTNLLHGGANVGTWILHSEILVMQNMETRYTHSPADIRHYSTEQLREEFLVEKVFIPGAISLTYTHNDRMIFGGVTPTTEELEIILDK